MRNLLINWLICCVIVLCLGASCAKPGKWTATNSALQTAFLATVAVDYYQTTQPDGIVDRCQEWHPLIGECGDRLGPTNVLLLTAGLHTAIALTLSERWRLIFQSFTLGVESNVVWTNYQMGYGFLGYARKY